MPRKAKTTKITKTTYPKGKKTAIKGTYAKPEIVTIKKKPDFQAKLTPLFPVKKWVHMPFVQSGNSVLIASTNTDIDSWSLNGAWKPDMQNVSPGSTHRAMGFDQMINFYEHYFVTYAKVKVTFKNDSTEIMKAGIYINPDVLNTANIDTLQENGMIKPVMLQPKNVFGSTAVVYMNANIAKLNGLKSVLTENDYRGNAQSNPAEQTYLSVKAWDPTGTALTGKVFYDIAIEYTVCFTEPRKAISSLG